MSKKNNTINGFLFLIIGAIFSIPYLSSCGKSSNASSVGLNVQFEVVNLSPNIQPVDLYMDFIKQNTTAYSYPFSQGYFFLNSITMPLQVKTSSTTSASNNFFTLDNLNFQANHKYSLFIAGTLNVDTALSTITPIFTEDDSTAIPPVGFGKIRFVDAAIQSTGIDVTANGSSAFKGVKFAAVSPYVLLPAGNYVFQMSQTGLSNTVLSTTLGTQTIQDGRLYTLYSYGVPTHTDSSAFNAAIITNR